MTLRVIVSLLIVLLSNNIAHTAPDGYIYDNISAYVQDDSKANLKLRIRVDSSEQPEYWRLERKIVESATKTIAVNFTVEQIIGHKNKFQDALKLELDKRLKEDKVTVTEVQIVTMSFDIGLR